MDDLIGFCLRFVFLLFLSPFWLGLLCGLAALYAVGSDWPTLAAVGLGIAWSGLWSVALWRLVRA